MKFTPLDQIDNCLMVQYLSLTTFHDNQLLLRRSSGEHNFCMVFEDLIQVTFTHILQFSTMDHTGLSISRDTLCISRHLEQFHMPHLKLVEMIGLPWIDISNRNVQTSSNVFHSLIAFRDDANTFCNSLSCNWMVPGNHDNLYGKSHSFKLLWMNNL